MKCFFVSYATSLSSFQWGGRRRPWRGEIRLRSDHPRVRERRTGQWLNAPNDWFTPLWCRAQPRVGGRDHAGLCGIRGVNWPALQTPLLTPPPTTTTPHPLHISFRTYMNVISGYDYSQMMTMTLTTLTTSPPQFNKTLHYSNSKITSRPLRDFWPQCKKKKKKIQLIFFFFFFEWSWWLCSQVNEGILGLCWALLLFLSLVPEVSH